MPLVLALEEFALFGLSIVLFSRLEMAWWWYPVLFFAPDLSMLGYVFGNKIGALIYNLFHHKAVAIVVLTLGGFLSVPWLSLAGVILLGHSSLDRVFGYGLKSSESFHKTHLGTIGKPGSGN